MSCHDLSKGTDNPGIIHRGMGGHRNRSGNFCSRDEIGGLGGLLARFLGLRASFMFQRLLSSFMELMTLLDQGYATFSHRVILLQILIVTRSALPSLLKIQPTHAWLSKIRDAIQLHKALVDWVIEIGLCNIVGI